LFIFSAQNGFRCSGDRPMAQALRNSNVMASAASHPHDARERPVDLVHLGAMTQGDGELEREVLAIFLTQAGQYLAAYRGAPDKEGRRRAAHTLKGAARGIGAWRLAQIAEAAEAVADPDSIARETDRVCEYIRRLG
jgi:HPt (histidine-containing phosphotransfer) domain-containing protein